MFSSSYITRLKFILSVDGFIQSLGEVNVELESVSSAVDEMMNQFTHISRKVCPKISSCIGVHVNQFISPWM